jgi:hypothetical protein
MRILMLPIRFSPTHPRQRQCADFFFPTLLEIETKHKNTKQKAKSNLRPSVAKAPANQLCSFFAVLHVACPGTHYVQQQHMEIDQ